MLAYRIATEAVAYSADDMSGTGAKTDGGRWNSIGIPLLYTSPTIALTVLETVVHFPTSGLPFNRYLVEIDIPDAVWLARQEIDHLTAPVGWDALPAGRASVRYGDQWVASGSSAILLVPSVIVPEEQNILINPAHPDAAGITAKSVRRWSYDPRFGA